MFRRAFSAIGTARVIAMGIIGLAVLVRILDPIPVQTVRNLTFDFFQRVQPREMQAFPVTIIDVDDASITEVGQWPWPRTRFAEIVELATADGAVAIAFDILFAEPDRLSPARIASDNPELGAPIVSELLDLPDNDDVFAQAMSRAQVVVGQSSARNALSTSVPNDTIFTTPHGLIGGDPTNYIMRLPDLIQNLQVIEEAAAGRGLFNARPDSDGVYRRLPFVAEAGGQLRLGLSLELLRIATGGEAFVVETNEAGVDNIVLARNRFETAGDGTVRPYLTPSMPSRFVPAADLLTGRMEPGRLSGHLVLVGTSAVGLGDFRTTPLGVRMSGVEIHAQLLESILSQSLLGRPNYAIAVELVTTVAICILFVILTPIMNARILVVATTMFLSATAVASFVAFQQNRFLIDPSFPIIAGIATIMFMATANYIREERQRAEIRNAFRHYVSGDLVNLLSQNRDKLQLGGETRDLTLLFSDVRGFTAIAESFRESPEGLTRLMNRLMNQLSKPILDERGTIDKFMGDAVMAFWNAPLSNEDHARSACRAALEMKANVARLNQERQREAAAEYHEFRALNIGIGIATGSCMVGNMGSDSRFDYTALGDPVNLASRLEGQTSHYGVTILVGEDTAAVAKDAFALLELDAVRLKGKTQAEHIFALMGDAQMRNDARFRELVDLNIQMLAAYRARDWDAAESALEKAEPIGTTLDPDLTFHFAMYRERMIELRNGPLPDDWDGIRTATSK